jgi:hypothetical protein
MKILKFNENIGDLPFKAEIVIIDGPKGEKCYSPRINDIDIQEGYIFCNAIRKDDTGKKVYGQDNKHIAQSMLDRKVEELTKAIELYKKFINPNI